MPHQISHRNKIVFVFTLTIGFGLALAIPLLANTHSYAARQIATVKNVPEAPAVLTDCYATLDDGVNTYFSSDASALRAAVYYAAPGDVVKLAGYCKGVQFEESLTQTVLITKNLTLEGGHDPDDWKKDPNPEIYTTTLDADKGGRVITIFGGVDVNLKNLYITDG